MRVISRGTLRSFWERQPDAEQALKAWYATVQHAHWQSPHDVKAVFRNADVLRNGRVVFNIRDGRFRLVVRFHFNTGMAYVRFIGTHRDYDAINAETV